jgi:hypothetical protein
MKKMKKLVLSLLIGSSVYFCNAQAVDKGNIIIDAYIGGPQLLSKIKGTDTGGSTWKSSGIGPFGGRLEYMFSKKSSIGVETNYATSTIEYSYTDPSVSNYDSFSEKYTFNRFRFFPRYALHFGGKKLDAYFHAGIGLALWTFKSEVTDPSTDYDLGVTLARTPGTTVAFRTGMGLRYFFTENIGLNVDFGLGGALFTGGISAKF